MANLVCEQNFKDGAKDYSPGISTCLPCRAYCWLPFKFALTFSERLKEGLGGVPVPPPRRSRPRS